MQYDAIILAGGESSSELKKIVPYDNEALIIIGQYPMVDYVYKALRRSSFVRNIVISGPVEALRNLYAQEENLIITDGGKNAVDSFTKAVEALNSRGCSEKLLIMPTDIPFITTEAINDFIQQSENYTADFYYPVTSKNINNLKFPGVARTYVKLREGTFTGGNLFIVNSLIIEKILDIAEQLVVRRKKPLAMARLFGLRLVYKYLTGTLSVEAIEKRFQKVVGIKGKAIISSYAEIGVDVDKPSDLELTQKYLTGICS